MTEPRPCEVAIGVPVHNGARHLRRALDSLLSQRFEDFGILILDDGSTDGSDGIIRSYAERDARVQHVRHPERQGLIETWRRVAELCHERFQSAFFAWYSDHDWVEPEWLGRLHTAMRDSGTVALAHARTCLADSDGRDTGRQMDLVETEGLDVFRRLDKAVFSHMGAGDAVYGLFRWSVLRACGIFRDELMPDRLLVAEVNLHGEVVHVDEAVRFRRRTHVFTDPDELVDRQMQTLFPDRSGGRAARARPYASHATTLLRLALQGSGGDSEIDLARLYLGVLYYQRCLTKFREPLLRERSTASTTADAFDELVGINLETPSLMPVATHRHAETEWVRKARALEHERDEARAETRSLGDTLEEVSGDRDTALAELAATRAERTTLEEQLTKARNEISTLVDANTRLQQTITRRVEELAGVKTRYRWTRLPGAIGLAALKIHERWKASQ